MSYDNGVISNSFKIGAYKTFKNPMTYIGAAIVGGVSLMTKDFAWGILSPFIIPLLVQASIRILAEYEYRDMLTGNNHISTNDNPRVETIADISSFPELFHSMPS